MIALLDPSLFSEASYQNSFSIQPLNVSNFGHFRILLELILFKGFSLMTKFSNSGNMIVLIISFAHCTHSSNASVDLRKEYFSQLKALV